MIVTRSWLDEFIDLSGVSNEKLYESFNSIGLEVDSMKKVEIAKGVVVGKIISCVKHPNADKLNVCQINIGKKVKQIVCGAKNVVDAKFVAVATIGTILSDNFEIKDAKLRGVESSGMVCSSSELGLPDMGNGIMILDESIGELEVGRELNSYEKITDTIIELELTANRGDCLSVYGVARDLSSGLNIAMRDIDYKVNSTKDINISQEVEIINNSKSSLSYNLASIDKLSSTFLLDLRLATVGVEAEDNISTLLAYSTHSTGIILRGYETSNLYNKIDKTVLETKLDNSIVELSSNDKQLSNIGINQNEDNIATDSTKKLLIEASYINPDILVEAVANSDLKTDILYYKTSRGSNPQLSFGMQFLTSLMNKYIEISFYSGSVDSISKVEERTIIVTAKEISSIIGMDIKLNKIVTILEKLEFKTNHIGKDSILVTVPPFRHDVNHIQDITEEIVRIIGINNIDSKPLAFVEQNRLNSTTDRYKAKKGFKNRAVGAGFYENISYIFSDRDLLTKYNFPTLEDDLELSNPIAKELNTLRSTVLINLLNAVKRNVSYSRKSIPLFEMGAVFNSRREQSEVLSFVFSGELENDGVKNSGKPEDIDFASFTQKVGAVIGDFELIECSYNNGLIHPYQSADVIVDGKVSGFIAKLHPVVADEFDIPVTFIAELDFDTFLPKHVNSTAISKFQGVYKDLSIVIDKSTNYYEVAKVVNSLNLPLVKDSYPVDIYVDEKLGDKKSLTIRFFIQSMDKTLKDSDTQEIMEQIMRKLEAEFKAELR